MRCDEVGRLLADRLDDLLEPESAGALDEHLAGCEACQEAMREAAAVRDALYRPWPIESTLPALVVRPRRGGARRVTLALLRYAAVFVAGVLAARLLATAPPAETTPNAAPAPSTVPAIASPFTDYPRRIR